MVGKTRKATRPPEIYDCTVPRRSPRALRPDVQTREGRREQTSEQREVPTGLRSCPSGVRARHDYKQPARRGRELGCLPFTPGGWG